MAYVQVCYKRDEVGDRRMKTSNSTKAASVVMLLVSFVASVESGADFSQSLIVGTLFGIFWLMLLGEEE